MCLRGVTNLTFGNITVLPLDLTSCFNIAPWPPAVVGIPRNEGQIY